MAPSCPLPHTHSEVQRANLRAHRKAGSPRVRLGSQGPELPLPHSVSVTSFQPADGLGPRSAGSESRIPGPRAALSGGAPRVSDPRAPSCPCHLLVVSDVLLRLDAESRLPRAPSCPCHQFGSRLDSPSPTPA